MRQVQGKVRTQIKRTSRAGGESLFGKSVGLGRGKRIMAQPNRTPRGQHRAVY